MSKRRKEIITMQKSAEEISEAVAQDLKSRGYTHQRIADRLGKTKNVISNQLTGKRPFSKQMALLFASHFNYNLNFLLYGSGELSNPENSKIRVRDTTDVDKLNASIWYSLLEVAKNILNVTGQKEGLAALNSLMDGDFSGYKLCMEQLMLKLGVNEPIPLLTAKYAADQINNVLNEARESSSGPTLFDQEEGED